MNQPETISIKLGKKIVSFKFEVTPQLNWSVSEIENGGIVFDGFIYEGVFHVRSEDKRVWYFSDQLTDKVTSILKKKKLIKK